MVEANGGDQLHPQSPVHLPKLRSELARQDTKEHLSACSVYKKWVMGIFHFSSSKTSMMTMPDLDGGSSLVYGFTTRRKPQCSHIYFLFHTPATYNWPLCYTSCA
ncbi:hypothetical protein P8452_45674 [Trifolium repens]|nr:hypothetical protein P8452_45674 [Trifolium repens]